MSRRNRDSDLDRADLQHHERQQQKKLESTATTQKNLAFQVAEFRQNSGPQTFISEAEAEANPQEQNPLDDPSRPRTESVASPLSAAHFKMMDTNNDGKVSSEEYQAAMGSVEHVESFNTIDADHDGFISVSERERREEYLAHMRDTWFNKEEAEQRAELIFRNFDLDQSGQVNDVA